MSTLKNLVNETTNIKNELITCYADLKNNLAEKGIECSNSDKLLTLVDKVGEIELGKKWASGTCDTIKLTTTIETPNLTFTPTIVILTGKVTYYNSSESKRELEAENVSISTIKNGFEFVRSNLSYAGHIENITQTGFTVAVHSNPTSRFAIENPVWYVFE